MACQMNTIAHLLDVESVKRRLFPNEQGRTANSSVSPDSWVWPDEDTYEDASTQSKGLGKDVSWLQDCNVSMSSTTERLIISHKNNMVILSSKWDMQEEGDVKTKYHITWHGNPCQQPEEQITCVLCLPIISQGKSTHCGPDWTCIVVGFSSGYIRFYTENCNFLLSEMLYNEPVRHLKCQSYQTPHYSPSREPTEEIYVVYKTAVCIIPGFGLFQTLRACRNQLARVQANCKEVIQAPPLTFKKWGFQEQESITDCAVVGPALNNSFDHLQTASIIGGFNTWYRSSPPQTSVIVAAGKKPFVGFHYALEGGAPPMLTDVAKVVANKLKSAIGQAVPTWLMGGRKNPNSEKKEVPLDPPDPMIFRFGLCDHWRQGDRLIMSPNRNLSVVNDSLGRIILVDNQKGVAVRMWKGYREAQCGWLEVKEDGKHHREGSSRSTPHLRTALFLVVYSPKKGIIEIWTMQQGPRIATFSVSKSGRLLYTEYGYMGVNNVQLKGGNKSQFPIVFVDPNGGVKEITVPFHFALSAVNSKRVRDLHVLKKLKTFMKEEEFEDEQLTEEVTKTAEQLETNEIRYQALEMLSSNRAMTPNALEAALSISASKWVDMESESQDSLVKLLVQLTRRFQRLVTLYRFIYDLNQQPPEYMTVVSANLTPSVLSTKLRMPEREVDSLLKLISKIQIVDAAKKKTRPDARVTFGDGNRTTFVEFLSCFETINTPSSTGQETDAIYISKTASDEELKRISELLFQGTLYSECNINEWKTAAVNSFIRPAHLMKLALLFWMNRRQGIALESEMLRYTELLKSICSLADVEDICVEYNELSPWWSDVRDCLTKSPNSFMALTAAIVCRAVALSIESNKDRVDDRQETSQDVSAEVRKADSDNELTQSPSTTSEWENVSSDTCQWSVLIGQLEDVALLSAMLRQKPHVDEKASSKTRYCRPFEYMDISLDYILTKGKGSVSELVAHWLSSTTIEPILLIDQSDVEFDNGKQSTEPVSPSKVKNVGVEDGEKIVVEMGSEASNVDEVNSKILGFVKMLKRHFPYSMTSSVLLANMCWEFMLLWHKAVDEMQALDAAFNCLRVIPSSCMRRGLCSLMWSMHLEERFERVTLLIQKVGKTPKERLCRQEVGLSDTQLTQFSEKCLTFIDLYLEASGQEPVDFPLRHEELWPVSTIGPPSLAELALSKRTANFDLIFLHHQLALVIHMMLVFNIKFSHPINTLFDSSSQSAIYNHLSDGQRLPVRNPDMALTSSRMQFLFRVISAAMQTIRIREDSEVEGTEVRFDASQAVFWMGRCQGLGSAWAVGGDPLRRHQICELYSSGFDRIAEEVIPAVVDLPLLASQLMLICGQRIRYIIETSPNLAEKMSQISTALSRWLLGMPENSLKKMSCPLSDTAQLLTQVIQYLPEEHPEFNLALQLVDAVHAFQDS